MNAEQVLLALNDIPDEYVLSAETRRGRPRRFGMIAACIAAALVLTLGTFTAAMAADGEFRAAVFSFFRIAAPETVLPVDEEPARVEAVEKIYERSLGDGLSVEYFRFDGDFDAGNGIIWLYRDEARNSADFYAPENGALVKLETRRVDAVCEWDGRAYEICFDWCAHGGNLVTFGRWKQPGDDMYWDVAPIPGRSDVVQLTLSHGRAEEYKTHVFFLELATQTVIDPFEGCGLDALSNIVNITFSREMSKALISCEHATEHWYCDLEAKTLVRREALLGREADGWGFIDDDTLCFYTMDENYRYSYYTRQLSSGVEKTILADTPRVGSHDAAWGVWMGSDAYQLYVAEDGSVSVLNLKTGQFAGVEGFALTDCRHTKVIPNRSEDKLLLVTADNAAGGLGVSQIGVLDLEEHTLMLLDREGYEARYEAAVSWFDDTHVKIWAVTEEYGYLYLYTID